MLDRFSHSSQLGLGTHLSAGFADGVGLLVESAVALNHVEDGSVAHLVLDVVAMLLSWLITES